MTLHVSGRIATLGQFDRTVQMPTLPDQVHWNAPVSDRIGEAAQELWPAAVVGGVAGAIAGAKLLRGGRAGVLGLLAGIGGSVGGALVGLGSIIGLGTAIRGNRSHALTRDAAAARAPGVTVEQRENVKLMTYNIHGGMGGPGAWFSSGDEVDRLAEVIKRERPDVLILQEVDRFAFRSSFRDDLSDLTNRLHPDSAVSAGGTTTPAGRDQDVGVMTFNGFTVKNARNIIHPDPLGGGIARRFKAALTDLDKLQSQLRGKEYRAEDATPSYQVRNSIDTIVRTPGGTDLRVLGGHYEGPKEEHDFQASQVAPLTAALGQWRGPTILGADFNVRSDTPWGASERKLFGQAGLVDAFSSAGMAPDDERRLTTPGGTRIDRIYHSAHAKVLDVHVVRDDWASDHHAVVSELQLQPGGSP